MDTQAPIQIPPGEILWVRYFDAVHTLRYVLTSKPLRDSYTLYAVSGGALKKVASGPEPKKLEERMRL